MKLLVDGVSFQLGIARLTRIWASILSCLAARSDLDVVLLDRGGCPPVEGARRVEFPSYTLSATPADSLLIDEYCSELGIDVFTSTFYTTPVTVPAVLLLDGLAEEPLDCDLNDRAAREKEIAIAFAAYYACTSQAVRAELQRRHPGIAGERIVIVENGADGMARALHGLAEKARKERESPSAKRFFLEWKRLRTLQAEVDVGITA